MIFRKRNKKLKKDFIKRKMIDLFRVSLQITGLVIFIALIWGAYTFFLTSPYFAIKKIEVSGVRQVDRGDIEEFLSVTEGSNIFTADVNALRQKVEAYPWIDKAEVTRILPDSILVEIEEHVPVALVSLQGGLYFLDSNAKVFKSVESGELVDFPVITSGNMSQLKLTDIQRAYDFLKFVAEFDSGFAETISELNFTFPHRLNIYTKGLQIVINDSHPMESMLNIKRIRVWAKKMGIVPVFIDIVSERKAVAKLRKINNNFNINSLPRARNEKAGEING
ncbi:MAG TPA: FtsQ-type POTRA domain-containing protein [bacterium]